MPTRVLPITFPDDIARNITVSRSANTILNESPSGYEQALGLWSESRLIMSLSLSVISPARLSQAISFYEAFKGRMYGFRCRDHTDFWAGYSSPFVGASITPEPFGTGDGATLTFKLKKTYTVGSVTRVRTISRPRADVDLPLKIYKYIAGAWVLQTLTTHYTVDYETGIITFTAPPANTVPLGWAGLYDMPMRLDSDQPELNMKVIQIGSTGTLKFVQIKE